MTVNGPEFEPFVNIWMERTHHLAWDWMKKGIDLNRWIMRFWWGDLVLFLICSIYNEIYSFMPVEDGNKTWDLFHSALISRLGVKKLGSIQSMEMATSTSLIFGVHEQLSVYTSPIQMNDFHSTIQESLSRRPHDCIFLWCPMINTRIKWCKTRQSLCDSALHYGGVTYSPQLVCVLGVSSRLQLRPDTREDSSEGQMSVLLTWLCKAICRTRTDVYTS